jgi:hypothetical protein
MINGDILRTSTFMKYTTHSSRCTNTLLNSSRNIYIISGSLYYVGMGTTCYSDLRDVRWK